MVCSIAPDAAVTVMVEVRGRTDFCDPPPPQALSPETATPIASSESVAKRRGFFQPTQQSVATNAMVEKSGREPLRRTAVEESVVTVSVVVAATAPEGVTVAGEKLQEAPLGSPEQMNVTAALKPFEAVTETVVAPLLPALTVKDPGEAVREKFGGGNGEDGRYSQRSLSQPQLPLPSKPAPPKSQKWPLLSTQVEPELRPPGTLPAAGVPKLP